MNQREWFEINTSQLKIRELAQEYMQIQENTEFLTHLLRYRHHKLRLPAKLDQQTPQLKSLAALTTQLAYLLFTCHVKKINLWIGQNLMLLYPSRCNSAVEVYMEYILEKEFVTMSPKEKVLIQTSFKRHEFSGKDQHVYGFSVLGYIKKLLEAGQSQFQNQKLPANKLIVKQFENLEGIVRNFLEPKKNVTPRAVILCLEESEIFREHSTLVKVMNNSIFSAVRNGKNHEFFKQILRLEASLCLKDKKGPLENYSIEMEQTLQNMLLFFIKNQIITVEQSINSQGSGSSNRESVQSTHQYNIGDVEGSALDRKYSSRLLIHERPFRNFTSSVYESIVCEAKNNYKKDGKQKQKQKGKQDNSKNEYLIEYMSNKGLLSVKYVTSIELSIENTDVVMFQCNNIAYHWANVSIELVERNQSKQVKRKERYLAIKTVANLHLSEKPLFKFMLMIDLVMLCAKIAEPELKKTIVRLEDYNNIWELSEKVDHMIRLFLRKVQKFYKVIGESAQQGSH